MKRWLGLAGMLLGLAGCRSGAFPGPVSLSTKHSAVPDYEVIGEVESSQCGVVVVVIPVLDPWVPTEVFEDLLTKSDALRADALIDVRVSGGDLAGFYPVFFRACTRYVGTAVRFR